MRDERNSDLVVYTFTWPRNFVLRILMPVVCSRSPITVFSL